MTPSFLFFPPVSAYKALFSLTISSGSPCNLELQRLCSGLALIWNTGSSAARFWKGKRIQGRDEGRLEGLTWKLYLRNGEPIISENMTS